MIFYMLAIALLLPSVTTTAIDTTAFQMLVKNVTVPEDSISLDSTIGNHRYYSGIVRYDLESGVDLAEIHVYLEEVPFERYYITGYSKLNAIDTGLLHGNFRFIQIDSLCSGDVGRVKPGNGRTIYWHYSTSKPANHCRIKVGAGNYCYVNTMQQIDRNGTPSEKWSFTYNNLGLIAKKQAIALDNVTWRAGIWVPKYSSNGQLTLDDTSAHQIFRRYDERGRITYHDGGLIGITNSFGYDSLSRADTISQAVARETPNGSGLANTEYITFDNEGNIARAEMKAGYIVTSCSPVYEFIGREVRTYFFSKTIPGNLDSLYRECFEDARNGKLVSRIIERRLYSSDGRVQEDNSVSLGLDDPGTCWGTQLYNEQKNIYTYDSTGYPYRFDFFLRKSHEGEFVAQRPFCYRREYDASGNAVRGFDFCDTDETLRFRANYNQFNHIIRLEGGDIGGGNLSTVSTYTWELIDLDMQEEFFHESIGN